MAIISFPPEASGDELPTTVVQCMWVVGVAGEAMSACVCLALGVRKLQPIPTLNPVRMAWPFWPHIEWSKAADTSQRRPNATSIPPPRFKKLAFPD
jgi:hypothetical protein